MIWSRSHHEHHNDCDGEKSTVDPGGQRPGTEHQAGDAAGTVGEHYTIILNPVLSREERVKRLEGILRPYLKSGDDPIADLIRERELEDEEID
jgi:hypothetical protein